MSKFDELSKAMGEKKKGVMERVNGKTDYIKTISIDLIEPNPHQPRRTFKKTELEELAQSIKEHGLNQLITVVEKGGKFILISGERRLRAIKLLGYDSIKAFVRDIPNEKMRSNALIENIQREDLSSLEIAISLKELKEDLNIKSDKALADLVKKSVQQVRSLLSLNKLPDTIFKRLLSGEGSTVSIQVLERLSTVKEDELAKSLFEDIIKKDLNRADALAHIKSHKHDKSEKESKEKTIIPIAIFKPTKSKLSFSVTKSQVPNELQNELLELENQIASFMRKINKDNPY